MITRNLLVAVTLAPLTCAAADFHMQVNGSVTKLTYADCQTYAQAGYCTSWSFADVTQSNFVNGAAVRTGDAYSFDFIFNQQAPLSAISADGFQAIYFNAVRSQHFTAGGIVLPGTGLPQSNIGTISVVDGRSGTDYLLYQTVFGGEPGFSASLNLGFQDRSGRAINSFDIPSVVLLSDFTETGISIGFIRNADGDQVTLQGKVDLVFISPIPEPSISALLSLGLLVSSCFAASHRVAFRDTRKIAA